MRLAGLEPDIEVSASGSSYESLLVQAVSATQPIDIVDLQVSDNNCDTIVINNTNSSDKVLIDESIESLVDGYGI